MCGIAGIIGRLDETNRAALARMNDAMGHRGPDGSGTWESRPDNSGWGALLAHRRLSILDLSPSGAQPMIDPVTGCVVVFNGLIYNYRELRDQMDAEGQQFQSSGDTAILLRALGLKGANAVSQLRGMFAFACWNPHERRLLIARDHLGIKPLYLVRSTDESSGWTVAFASELRALLASGLLGTPRLDPKAVASFVWNGFVVGPNTSVAGVELFWPGQLMEFDGRGREVRNEEFWRVPEPETNPGLTEEDLAVALEEGVRLHLASDVPLAIFLSGGIDSSAVANLAQRASNAPVHTFTLAFEEQEFNEGPIARRVAEAVGTQHHEVMLTEESFTANLEPALDSLDQPTFDALNAYYVSRAIRDAGFTVAVSGTGGDELFGGYPSYRELPMIHNWSSHLRWMPRDLQVAAAKLGTWPMRAKGGAVPPQTRWAKLPHMAKSTDDLLSLYQLAYALFLPDFQRELLAEQFADPLTNGLPCLMQQRLRGEIRSRPARSAIGVLEQRLFLGERLLRDNDAASMAASLEQRVPLVDHVIFECVGKLAERTRFEPLGKKSILRRIGLKGLDPSLFERPKRGFVLPINQWLRRGLRGTMDEVMRDPHAVSAVGLDPQAVARLWQAFLEGAPGIYWSRIWSLFVLIRWCHGNGVLR